MKTGENRKINSYLSSYCPPHDHHRHYHLSHIFWYGSIAVSATRSNKYKQRNWNVLKATIHSVHLPVSAA